MSFLIHDIDIGGSFQHEEESLSFIQENVHVLLIISSFHFFKFGTSTGCIFVLLS